METIGKSSLGSCIRLATEGELSSLPEIELAAAQLFLEYTAVLGIDPALLQVATSPEALRRAQAASLLWVAPDALDRPVGFAYAVELDGRLHLEEMDVHPAHGRRGLGKALVEEVCKEARRRGRAVSLSTFRAVPWNAPFYARLGFRQLEESELTHCLRRLRADEARKGLPPEARTLMVRE
jgi:GNAT superfamily N-acetyltransferase